MIPGDDDISAALPRPPIPAPARRAAAMEAALRRFDGEAATPVRPPRGLRRRPYVGVLIAATLVALVAVPLAWESVFDAYRAPPPPTAAREANPPPAVDAVEPPGPLARPSDVAGPRAASVAPARAPDEKAARPAQASAEPAPVVTPARALEQAARQAEPAPALASADQLVVTGSRIRRPNLVSAVPVTVMGGGDLVRAASARSARRGDWNACTLDDPAPRRRECGPTRAPLAEGLDLARQGDLEGAVAAFGRAVGRDSRSSLAYLNRGMAYQRKGDLGRARADLDLAVRLAPNSARAFYRRSLLRRQQGDDAGAESDAKRALTLDPDYSAVLGE